MIFLCFAIEDIDLNIAKEIDKRLRMNQESYFGMTTVDISSENVYKSYWKYLIRDLVIENNKIFIYQYDHDEEFIFESYIKKNIELEIIYFNFSEKQSVKIMTSSFVNYDHKAN